MKICDKKDLRVITGIMAAALLLGGCTSTATPSAVHTLKDDPDAKTDFNLKDVESTVYDQELMDQEYRRYCIDLFSQTLKNCNGDENVMISPASIMMALDMVAAGAKNDSLRQLTDLFAAGQGPLQQQAYAAALMDKINTAEDVEFTCANAVWNNSTILGDKVNTEYVDYIRNTFLAEYTMTEFSGKTVGEINEWIDEHTNHMIKQAIDDLDPYTVMVLVNAIAFEGEWEEAYTDDQVRDGVFTTSSGQTQDVTYLYDESHIFYETDKATGFIKRYEGGQYAFVAILPKDESISANEFIRDFTPEDYEAFINSRTTDYKVYSKIPEFESDFELLMNDTIKDLGAGNIFTSDKADLSGIAGAPGDIYVSKVIHKTHIEVDSNGTKAAAVTVVEATLACCEEEVVVEEFRQVYCDRPFVYAIVDVDTMAPVFIGTVNAV